MDQVEHRVLVEPPVHQALVVLLVLQVQAELLVLQVLAEPQDQVVQVVLLV